MIWIDYINHIIWNCVDYIFNPRNNIYFYSKIFYSFCQWSNIGWNNNKDNNKID
jgi:hypothetical protein